MSDKAKKLIKKHFFYEMPHRGDCLNVCKLCHNSAWLIDDIQHKRSCEVGAALKELQCARGKKMKTDHNGLIYRCSLCKNRQARLTESAPGQCKHEGHRMSESADDYIGHLERENAGLKSANEALKVYISGQEAENAELKTEIKKLRSIVLAIQVLECDSHKLKGHECYAKHWVLSLLDRVKRLNKGEVWSTNYLKD